MGYGRVLGEILQNIPNKEVTCKIFSANKLGAIFGNFAAFLVHFLAKYSDVRG
jgi:hypothetical protein